MVRSFLHKVFVEDAVLKVFSLCLSIALFVLRSDLDAAAPAYVRVSYVAPTDRVLEVGAGSGYQAAVLARLAKEVFTLERHEVLVERARDDRRR